MKRIISLLIIPVMCLSICGCMRFVADKFDEYDEATETEIRSGFDGTYYIFSENTTLKIDAKPQGEGYNDKLNDGELEGKFDLWAWHDFELFILLDGWFYVYDIKGDKTSLENRLRKYTESELYEIYLDYRDYDWGMSGWARREAEAREKYPQLTGG